jgi:hypothetical protein
VFSPEAANLGIRQSVRYNGPAFQIQNLRLVSRTGPEGNQINEVLFAITQKSGVIFKEGEFLKHYIPKPSIDPKDPKKPPPPLGEKHFVEDLLNRTVFYKVGHHLSYNGTALQKGIAMMESEQLAAMATLDLDRISEGWKKTMPNMFLMQELIRKCKGKFFLMNEAGIGHAPTHSYPIAGLKEGMYSVDHFEHNQPPIYHQYNCSL